MGDFKDSLTKALPGGIFGIAASAFNHRFAEKSAQKQYDRQLDFWQMQNEYNHPAQQRRRLEQAGLNPVAAINGIAGNNTAGQLSSVPGNEVAQRGTVDLNALNNSMSLLGQLESVGANTDLLKEQIELAAIEQIVKHAKKYGLDLDNQTKEMILKWLPKEKRAAIRETFSRIRNNNESAKNTAEDTRGKQILNDEKQEARDAGINTFEDQHYLQDAQEYAALAQGDLASAQEKLAYKDVTLTSKKIIYQDLLNHAQSVANIADDIFLGEERRAKLDLLRTDQVSTELRMTIDVYLSALEGYLAQLKETEMWFNVSQKQDELIIKNIETTIGALKSLRDGGKGDSKKGDKK